MSNKNKQNINKVISQARAGTVKFNVEENKGYWTFYINFMTEIEGQLEKAKDNVPVLKIPNKKIFYEAVGSYLEKATKFYHDDKTYFDLTEDSFKQKLFSDLILNASHIDLNNIIPYVEKRTRMLSHDSSQSAKLAGVYENTACFFNIIKNSSNLEGPYTAQPTLRDCTFDDFVLPEITFGIDGDTAVVYCVQNPKKNSSNKTQLQKKFDRHFRKMNLNVDMESLEANISTNALASLTIFFAYLKNEGITNVEVPCFLPLRYNASLSAKIANLKKNFSNDTNSETTLKQQQEEVLEKQDRDQYNMTNKLMNLMLRYGEHFVDSKCEFDDIRDCMRVTLAKSKTKRDENIIYSLDESLFVSPKTFSQEERTK